MDDLVRLVWTTTVCQPSSRRSTRDLVGRMAARAAGMIGGLSPVPSEPRLKYRSPLGLGRARVFTLILSRF